jgi:hypothetical protein
LNSHSKPQTHPPSRQALLHHVPSWLAFGPLERVEWLNRLLAKAWPYYDAAICAEVKAQLEPLFEASKPGFIKKLFFAKLTMGDAPFRVEGVRVAAGEVAPGGAEGIELDVDFRWVSAGWWGRGGGGGGCFF